MATASITPLGDGSGGGPSTGIIACGAIARELALLVRVNGWRNLRLHCLPAHLHNRPQEIPAAVAAKIAKLAPLHDRLFVAYGDCGTAGALDAVLAKAGVERLPGAHCYEFLAAPGAFDALLREAPGTFFLTDFLVRHFARLVMEGLGLDRFPQLRKQYFGNYSRVVHLSQSGDAQLRKAAAGQAEVLGLAFAYRYTGLAPLAAALESTVIGKPLLWRAA